MQTCYSCGSFPQSTTCPARKMVEFSSVSKMATVYHIGNHTCHLKINKNKHKARAMKAVLKNSRFGPTQTKRNEVIDTIDQDRIEVAYEVAKELQVPSIKNAKNQLTHDKNANFHSFEGVSR